MNDDPIQVARGLAKDRRERLEKELLEIEGRMEALKHDARPVRYELERLARRRLTIMRELGMI